MCVIDVKWSLGLSRTAVIGQIMKKLGAGAAQDADREAAIDIANEKATDALMLYFGQMNLSIKIDEWEVKACNMLRQHPKSGKCRWYVTMSTTVHVWRDVPAEWVRHHHPFAQGVPIYFKDEPKLPMTDREITL